MLWRRLTICAVLMGVLLALPFYFRKEEGVTPVADDAETLVVITSHNKAVRDEYQIAFRKYYKEKYGKDIRIDFRSPGGTSDIMRYLDDQYTTAFRRYYEKNHGSWDNAYVKIFKDGRQNGHAVRQAFLNSDVGIGIDIFAGGGTFNMQETARCGFAVDGGVKERHPEYFKPESIPETFGGEMLYDPQGRYYGVVLSTFGILYNIDRIKEMGGEPPLRWHDLGDGRFFNAIVLADPTKSGSANKCFEIMIQQCMADAKDPAKGWYDGFNLLKRLFGNARAVTDSASKVVRDVGQGEAAAGTAIDTYGFAEIAWSKRCFDGKSKVNYVTPKGGTAVSADPVQILRGAPNRRAAEAFVDFLLSIEGQKLHAYKAGIPGGGVKSSPSRPAIRKELYAPEHRDKLFEADYDPYASGADFTYRPKWTGRYYSLIRVVIKSLMLDCQQELHAAWQAIVAAGGPEKVPEAMEYFNKLPFTYNEAADVAQKLKKGTPVEAAQMVRRWSDFARENYIKAEKLAREGK